MENQKLWLLQRISPTEGAPIVIKDGLYKIGRSIESNILCKSEWVSRFHCDLIVRDGFVFIRDLKSLNGTFIAENIALPDRDVEVKNGDLISLGKPYLKGEPVADHYVYKLLACYEPQHEKTLTRKRKAFSSTFQEGEDKDITSSPKRRKSLSMEKKEDSKKALEMQREAKRWISTEQGAAHSHSEKDLLPPSADRGSASTSADAAVVCVDLSHDGISVIRPDIQGIEPKTVINTTSGSHPDENDDSQVDDIDLTGFDESSDNRAGTFIKKIMKIIKNKDSEKVLKTIEMLIDKEENGEEGAPIESSRNDENCNRNLASTSVSSKDHKYSSSDRKTSPDSEGLLTKDGPTTEQSTKVETCRSSIPNEIKATGKQIQCVKDDPSTYAIEHNHSAAESISIKKISQNLHDFSDNEKNKKDTSKYELDALKNIISSTKDNNNSLKPNENEAGNLSTLQNIVSNSVVQGDTLNDSSFNQKEKSLHSTDTVPQNTNSVVENRSSELISVKMEDNNFLNIKHEVAEEMGFSQDVDDVVVEVSKGELEYSQISQNLHDFSDNEKNKKDTSKYELDALKNIISSTKDNNKSLKPNENEAGNLSTLQNIVRNSVVQEDTLNEESLYQKENRTVPENTNSVVENRSSELISVKMEDNSFLNLKCEAVDIEEEMGFSQDADGVVMIELSEDELEYSQLFMEQDEVEKEQIDKKPDPIVKEEFFYGNEDDNEDIDLFQSHFSQCSQEQEVIKKAETPKKKLSRSSSSEEEISGKQMMDIEMDLERENELKIKDVRVLLTRSEVETYFSSKDDNGLNQFENEPFVSDEALNKSDQNKFIEKFSGPNKESFLYNEQQLVSECSNQNEIRMAKNKKAIDLSNVEKFEPSNEFLNLKKSNLLDSKKTTEESVDVRYSLKIEEPHETPVLPGKSKHRRNQSVGKSDSKKSKPKKDSFNSTHVKQDKSKIPKSNLVNSYAVLNKEPTISNQTKEIISNRESVRSNQLGQIELDSKDFLNSYHIKRIESSKEKDIADKTVKLAPLDSKCGSKSVKSPLLSQPRLMRKRAARPRNKETSVTKEALKKKSLKEIAENRKVILKSLALKAKSEKNDTNDKTTNQKENSQINIKEEVSRSTSVVKITERSRSTILLEGFLEAPNRRKLRGRKKVAETGGNRPGGGGICNSVSDSTATSNSCNVGSANKVQTAEPVLEFGVRRSSLKTSNKSTPNKRVTFNPNVEIKLFECQGKFKSVNELGFKDKAAPSSPLATSLRVPTSPAVITTVEETFYDVVHWNAAWANEVKTLQGEPPVYAEKYNSKDSYISYKDYKRWLYPLMMYELWGNMCKAMTDDDINKRSRVFDGIVLECLHYGIHQTNGKNLLMLKCFFPLYGKQVQNIVDPMDILLIRAESASDGKRIVCIQFSLVYSAVRIASYRETLDPIAKHYLTTLKKRPDVCAYFDIIIYQSPSKPMSSGVLLRIRPTYNMMNELRQFESLIALANSPLSDIIIDPVKNCSVFLRQELENKIVTEYPLNDEQRRAILCSTQPVFANKPSISLIHGPPGTGKTQVIVGIIEQLLNRFKLKNGSKKKKILLCSQSNAAIDEICLRLLDVRRQLPREKRFKLTRFGRKEKIHPKVLEIQTATLARKEIEKTINDDLTLELSLHKATERMVATALENSHSPNYANYRRKYENVQKKIASLEAIVNNHSTVEARLKEIEKLIFDEELKVIYHSDIIATTLGSCSQRKIMKALSELSRTGDRRDVGVCIIDEATQVTEADVLLPLVYDVKNFILVGDPQQLPPYVISQTAKKCGLGQSLFSRLYKVWSDIPSAPVYMLTAQHRMHPEIAQFPSQAFYGGQLTTPSFLAIKRPFKPYAVITHNIHQDSGETNVGEASLVTEIAEKLLSEPEMKGLSIGLIVPYQRQRSLILERFHDKKLSKQLTVQTIDSYQGQERDIILLSCVRTSGVGFLNDNQRLNVALTRAKKAMYIIANFASLQATNIWKELLADAMERNLHFDIGTLGSVEDIFQFLFERKTKKKKTSCS